MAETNITPFSLVYNRFLSMITDDMYMELTKEDTNALLEELLINAIPYFEFPRQNIFDYAVADEENLEGHFNVALTAEEINILAVYMVKEWIGQQLASVENTRMKYSGHDFKFTSQANHLSKLISLEKDYKEKGFHLQRLYKRRIIKDGKVRSTLGSIMGREEDAL